MKVNFLIIGAQKCGTTTLFEILNSHPSITGYPGKEPHFFSSNKSWIHNLKDYHNAFGAEHSSLYFEASTTYTFYPLRGLRIWNDIYEYNPLMKFIYIVRKPIDRVISSYMHSYERGHTNLSLNEALIHDRLYIDVTRYYTQVRPYIDLFGRENVLLLDFQDLVDQREYVISQLSNFLSIDESKFSNFMDIKSNPSVNGFKPHYKFDTPPRILRLIRQHMPKLWAIMTDNSKRAFRTKPVLSIELQEMIVNMLELEIKELERLMGKDLGGWLLVDR